VQMSNGHNTWPAHQHQPRATSPSSSISSGSGAGTQRLFGQPEQQQQPQVHRPASAVAALQQSLSELAKLKAKFGQQQQQREAEQQQQLRAQQEQRWQQEQQQRSQEQQERELRRDAWLTAGAAAGGVRHHTHTLHAAAPAAAAAADTWGFDREAHASRASAWADQDTEGRRERTAQHQLRPQQQPWRNDSHSVLIQGAYSRWDAWQQQVHGDRQAQHQASGPQGASKQQALLRRSQSVPRLRRAWDDLPLDAHLHSRQQQQQQQRACGKADVLGRRSSSPGGGGGLQGVGLLRTSWQDGTGLLQRRQQQLGELHRPKTAGARVEGVGGRLHAAATTAAAGRGAGLGSTAGSGWLDSSPVKRAARLASLAGVGNAAATAGGRFGQAEGAGGAGTAAGSSWLPGGVGSSGARWGQQQVTGSSSIPTRLRSAAGVSGVLGASGQQQRSWLLPQQNTAAQQAAPVGACKAAVLASRAPAAAGGQGVTAAAARRQELVQRALSGYKPQQVRWMVGKFLFWVRSEPACPGLLPTQPERQLFHTSHTPTLMHVWRCVLRQHALTAAARQPCPTSLRPMPCCAVLCRSVRGTHSLTTPAA
jgi:chemotaxis protein histidine kinase CheA